MNNVEIKQAHTYTIHSIVPSDEKNGMLSFLLGYLTFKPCKTLKLKDLIVVRSIQQTLGIMKMVLFLFLLGICVFKLNELVLIPSNL